MQPTNLYDQVHPCYSPKDTRASLLLWLILALALAAGVWWVFRAPTWLVVVTTPAESIVSVDGITAEPREGGVGHSVWLEAGSHEVVVTLPEGDFVRSTIEVRQHGTRLWTIRDGRLESVK